MTWHSLTNDQLRTVATLMMERVVERGERNGQALVTWNDVRRAADAGGVKSLPLNLAAEVDDALDDPSIVAAITKGHERQ